MVEGVDFILCMECGKKFRKITWRHLGTHMLTSKEYRAKYPNAPMECEATKQMKSFALREAWERDDTKLGGKEWINRQSTSRKALWDSPDSVFRTKEYTKKQSDALTARWEAGKFDNLAQDVERSRKLSDATKAARARGCYDDMYTDEVRLKMSKSISKAYQKPESRKRASAARRRSWAKGVYDGVFVSPSKPELITEELLKELDLPYTFQYRIPADGTTYTVDFLIGNLLILEVFGDYWHDPNRPEQQTRDEKRLDWLEENGYDTLVLWEKEIKEDPQLCLDIIKNHVEEFSIFK